MRMPSQPPITGGAMIKVHTPKTVHEFPDGIRYLTEEDYNNLCVLDRRDIPIATFADGMWVMVELL